MRGPVALDVNGRQLGVLFPHGVLPKPELKHTLELISRFVEAWINAKPVSSLARPFLPVCRTRIFRI